MEMTFNYRFEAAHRFTDSGSKCSTPHGHTWWVKLSLKHSPSLIKTNTNFSWDFADLKKEWKHFVDGCLDHSFFCNSNDPLIEPLLSIHGEARLLKTPGDPTTEVLTYLFFKKAQVLLKPFEGVKINSIELQETPTNSIKLFEEDIPQLDRVFNNLNTEKSWWNNQDPLSRTF